MSSLNTDGALISTVLNRLENLEIDKYIIAFGPDGKQFIGTPNGYSATYLPSKPLAELAGCDIKKVSWASFGDTPESWFFAYEFKNGVISLRLGDGAPDALRSYIDQISGSKPLLGSLRVQLGNNGSFVVWSKTAWACCNVPEDLRIELCELSSASREYNGVTKGSLKKGSLTNVQWNEDGSFFLHNSQFGSWAYRTAIMRGAWSHLWQDLEDSMLGPEHLAELAYVAIDAHALTSETFAFVKKQKAGEETPFVLHIGQEPVHARLFPSDSSLQHVVPDTTHAHFRWATSRRSRTPRQDTWELQIKMGEKVKVLQDMGRDWFVVEGKKGIKGWVHGSWLDFTNRRFYQDSKTAYARFSKEMQKMMVPGQLRSFPSMSDYVDTCTRPDCWSGKDDGCSVGICFHGLEALLRGSARYSYAWLKEERNTWHPDRFARFCHPEHAGQLKVKAEQMFVLYSMLMQVEKQG